MPLFPLFVLVPCTIRCAATWSAMARFRFWQSRLVRWMTWRRICLYLFEFSIIGRVRGNQHAQVEATDPLATSMCLGAASAQHVLRHSRRADVRNILTTYYAGASDAGKSGRSELLLPLLRRRSNGVKRGGGRRQSQRSVAPDSDKLIDVDHAAGRMGASSPQAAARACER